MIDRACISLNHRCNLTCSYCHFAGKENRTANKEFEFSESEVRKIVYNIVEYCKEKGINTFKLGIVGSGEPLLSFAVLKAIVEEARILNQSLFKMYTISNGTIIDDEQLRFFYENRDIISLNFSLDGPESVHGAARQGFNKTMAAAERYERVFGEKPRVNATCTRLTLNNSEEVISFFLENGFKNVDFSIVSDTDDVNIRISEEEYEDFLGKCKKRGLTTRQTREGSSEVRDCAKYGRLCGVGVTNIFYTRKGIYPCGRFFGRDDYIIAPFDSDLNEVEKNMRKFIPVSQGECYYDVKVVKNI